MILSIALRRHRSHPNDVISRRNAAGPAIRRQHHENNQRARPATGNCRTRVFKHWVNPRPVATCRDRSPARRQSPLGGGKASYLLAQHAKASEV